MFRAAASSPMRMMSIQSGHAVGGEALPLRSQGSNSSSDPRPSRSSTKPTGFRCVDGRCDLAHPCAISGGRRARPVPVRRTPLRLATHRQCRAASGAIFSRTGLGTLKSWRTPSDRSLLVDSSSTLRSSLNCLIVHDAVTAGRSYRPGKGRPCPDGSGAVQPRHRQPSVRH
jgi:hypothetical protein